MGNKIAASSRIEHIRMKVLASLLPDVCQVYPLERVPTGRGTSTVQRGTPLDYFGSTDIPCRMDASKHFSYDELMGQETTVNEYIIHFPADFEIFANHEIDINGRTYEIRKMLDQVSNQVTKEVQIAELKVGANVAS